MWLIVVLAFFILAVANEIEWKTHSRSSDLTTPAVRPIAGAPAEERAEWAAILEHEPGKVSEGQCATPPRAFDFSAIEPQSGGWTQTEEREYDDLAKIRADAW